jgi:glycosyltransferase involved in cell wall biosynthesis
MPAAEVSVLMPVFNAAETAPRAIETIRRQTLRHWELVVVDDGSTDHTIEKLRRIAAEEPRLRVITTPHAGIVKALNTGLAEARSPLIARMDADDEAHPDRLAAQVNFLRERSEVGLTGCLVEFGGNRHKQAGYARHVDWINSLVSSDDIELNRFVESPFAHPSVVFRRALAGQHGAYRHGQFPEDYELWLRWIEANVVTAKVPRILLKWNDSPRRLSRVDPRYDPEAFYRCKAGFLARWLRRHVPPHRRILVWGAGRPTRRRAELLAGHGVNIAGYIDIDPRKIGRALAGRPVFGPERIPAPSECFVLGYVAKRQARELTRTRLTRCGFVEGKDFLMAA